jgi:radical SAM superfamily enzyme YgiQ (UPF0313 family)
MQILSPDSPRERIGFVVPRWINEPVPFGCQGLPFRCLSVAGALYNAGYEVVYFDEEHDVDRANRMPQLQEALRDVRIVFIWMSELTPMIQTEHMLSMARRMKEWYPSLRVAAGGSFITICPPEALFVDWPIDYFIRGYGEEAAPALMAMIRGEKSPDDVSGLVWCNGGHRFNPLEPHQRFRAEDTRIYRLLDLAPYIQKGGIFGNNERTFVVGTARGCAKGCTFCYWRNHEPSLLDAASIVELIDDLHRRYGVKQYHLAELDFFTNRKRPMDLAKLWRDRLPECTWFTLGSPVDLMKLGDADWTLLSEGGCRKLEMGAESGSPRMLQAIGKRHKAEDPYVLSQKMLDNGINPMINFVFGLYGETDEDRRLSLDLIRRLHDLAPETIHFTFRFYQPAWQTPMGDLAIAQSPDYPRTIEDVLTFRPRYGDVEQHEMGWLSPRDEEFIKEIATYFLPLATSKFVFTNLAERAIYRGLRAVARLRLRTQYFNLGVDRWLYRRFLNRALDSTYIA